MSDRRHTRKVAKTGIPFQHDRRISMERRRHFGPTRIFFVLFMDMDDLWQRITAH